jgi:hypothetical protein
MHVHAAQHVALPDHLQQVHHLRITALWTLHGVAPSRERMRSARQNRKTVFSRCCRCAPAQAQQFLPRLFGAAMRFGCNFDLRLQELAADMASRREIGTFKQRIGRLRRRLQSFRVGQKIFLLDAELEPVIGDEGRRVLPGGNQSPDVQSTLFRVESEFHVTMRVRQPDLTAGINSPEAGRFRASAPEMYRHFPTV